MSLTPRLDSRDQNFIINGGFDYWQRGGYSSSVNTSTSFAYVADRWMHKHTGTFTGTPNVQRSSTVSSNRVSSSLQHTFRRNASTAELAHQQRIESVLARQLVASGKCSVSFYINSSLSTGSVRVRLKYATASDNHTSQTEFYDSGAIAVATASVWQLVELEDIAVSASNLNGMALFIEYTLPSATDGSDQNIKISEICINKNSASGVFTPAGGDSVVELMLCQRYYERMNSNNGTIFIIAQAFNATSGEGVKWFEVTKRAIPSITFGPNWYVWGGSSQVSITPSATEIHSQKFTFSYTSASIGGTGSCHQLFPNGSDSYVAADAEL